MEHKKVSIIIPVYNSEKFLKKCIDSVVNQTLTEIEIIIVNDGSTDGSLNILKDYDSVYTNIILLDQENAGYSATVNRALNIAGGEYIAFVDGDDYIEYDALETLYLEASTGNFDLIIYNWDRVDSNGHLISYNDHSNFANQLLDRNEIIQEFFLNSRELVEGYSWNKLIKRDLFNEFNIRYPNMNYSDMPAMFKVLTKMNKCKYINKPLYHYVQNNTSISHTKNENNVKGFIKAVQMIYDILVEEDLILEFEDAYFIYKSNAFFEEYSVSRELLKNSKELKILFAELLRPITVKKCISLNKIVNLKLFIKVCLYKVGLLIPLLTAYHKFKPVLK